VFFFGNTEGLFFEKWGLSISGYIWVASPEKAARQIYRALEKRKKVVYVSYRWRMVAILLRLLSERV